jgi:hypothetical protein
MMEDWNLAQSWSWCIWGRVYTRLMTEVLMSKDMPRERSEKRRKE